MKNNLGISKIVTILLGKKFIFEVKPIMRKVERYQEGEKWSADVKTKWDPPEGLFRDGSAEKIASAAASGHSGDLGSAIQALQFYLNRGGENVSDEIKSKVNRAIDMLQAKNDKKESISKKKESTAWNDSTGTVYIEDGSYITSISSEFDDVLIETSEKGRFISSLRIDKNSFKNKLSKFIRDL